MSKLAPSPDGGAGRNALAGWRSEKSILGALSSLHRDLGDVFRLSLPGFEAVMLAGPAANHWVLVEQRANLLWRMEGDPVAQLLHRGLLMQDGLEHDRLRAVMAAPLHRRAVAAHVETFARHADEQAGRWDPAPRDMLVEMRRLALSVLMDALFGVDVRPHVDEIWQPLLRTLDSISPGLWLFWRAMPRPGYDAARRQLDQFLYALIASRRQDNQTRGDMLDLLMAALGDDNELIHDQLLTLLIAGHDTSTALLAWALYLLGLHPGAQARARAEVLAVCGDGVPGAGQLNRLPFLGSVIKETLRLYPPIHIGNRRAAVDLEFHGRTIPAGTRVLYSIYLGHRDPRGWAEPACFNPDRFAPGAGTGPSPFSYLPFGGGPRFCIGAAFAEMQARVILARMLQNFQFELMPRAIHPHMGATLEPRPGVWMRARRVKR